MEVLLLQDVQKVGKKNDLLIVGDGYALNHLLPLRMAIVATPTVRQQYADAIRGRAQENLKERELASGLAASIEGIELIFGRKLTKTGKLYAAVTEKHIVDALKKEQNIDVSEDMVVIPDPIKAEGTFQVQIKAGDQKANVKVIVKEEK